MKLTVAPLTTDRWLDLEAIFNAKGCSVARGCWCMAYRLSGSGETLPPGMTRAQAIEPDSKHSSIPAIHQASSATAGRFPLAGSPSVRAKRMRS